MVFLCLLKSVVMKDYEDMTKIVNADVTKKWFVTFIHERLHDSFHDNWLSM